MLERINHPVARRLERWLWKHPFIVILLTFLSFALIFLPQEFNAIWYAFSTEAPIPTIAKKMNWHWTFPALHFSASWITGPIGIVMLIVILVLLIRGKRASEDDKFRLRLEVDTKPRVTDALQIAYSGVFVAPESHVIGSSNGVYEPIGFLLLLADLRVYFDNRDTVTSRVEGIAVTLRREANSIPLKVDVLRDGKRLDISRDGIVVEPGQRTFYRLDCSASLNVTMKPELDERCYLRVEMVAIRQPKYCVDLTVKWAKTLTTNERAEVEVKRAGAC